MPKEISLNDPLSGAEIKAIILARIEAAMDANCTLADDIAYPGFTLAFEVKIGFVRAPTAKTLVWGVANEGEGVADVLDSLAGDYKSDSPNVARMDHDLPQPVVVQTPDGPKRKKVTFQKPAAYVKV